MKQFLCTRYPVDKRNGGVSREWLLGQRFTAKYPNLLVEIALHPAPPALIAIKAGISEDVLIDILLGKDLISYNESRALIKAMHTYTGYPTPDFVFSHALDCDHSCEDGDCLKEARRAARALKYKHPAVPLLKRLLREANPPHAALMMLDSYSDYQKPEYARSAQITPRTQPFKEWEAYEESESQDEEETKEDC